MNRREWIITALGASLAACSRTSAGVEGALFHESDEVGVNPERGFYVQVASEQERDFQAIRDSGLSLILLTVDLKRFRSRQLKQEDLAGLERSLKAAREAGLKVIFRAAYGFTGDDYRVDPEDLGLIRGHIWSVAEMLSAHAPILWAVQAGMLGPWGEWHGSVHGSVPSLEARKVVAEAWLRGLPESVFVQIRRPRFVRDMFSDKDSRLVRVGWHNDALLALPDDMGTYNEQGWDRERELEWSFRQGEKAPFGGETVPRSEGTGGAQVFRELGMLRASYLNQGYHGGTLNGWKTMKEGGENLFHKVEKSLGYRWVLRDLKGVKEGRIVLEMENVGFASVYGSRKVEAAWLDAETLKPVGQVVDTGLELKGHCPEEGVIKAEFELAGAKEGLLVGLRMADSEESLREDGRYSVRLMNREVRFDEGSGWNVIEVG